MITEGTLNLIAKHADNIGVVGFWYSDSLRLLFILFILLVVCIFAVIGFVSVVKWLFTRKPKKRY